MRARKNNNRKAFTLVELLVVIIIISLLAAMFALPSFKQLGKARKDIARAKMEVIAGKIGQFYLDCQRYPDESVGLLELIEQPPDLEEKWNGPYLRPSQLRDPWDRDYIYIEEGQVNIGEFDLISLGADGQEGGEGEDEDIYYE